MNLFLVGLPGVGKSYWGQKLASHFSWEFYDLDGFIESKQNLTIPKIIEIKGEAEFRQIEQGVLLKLIEQIGKKNTVVACGGGTPVYGNGLETLKKHGLVVYLTDEVDIISQRLMLAESSLRPLIDVRSPEIALANICSLLKTRRPFYEQSHIIASVSGIFDFHLFTKRVELFTEHYIAGSK